MTAFKKKNLSNVFDRTWKSSPVMNTILIKRFGIGAVTFMNIKILASASSGVIIVHMGNFSKFVLKIWWASTINTIENMI